MVGFCCRAATAGALAAIVSLALNICLLSCGGNPAPLAPEVSGRASLLDERPGCHSLWGYYIMRVNDDHSRITVQPARAATYHLNALSIMETYNSDSVSILNTVSNPDGTLIAEIMLTHPLPDYKKYTGFDVRGIVMLPDRLNFPAHVVKLPGFTAGEPALLNADGYTRWWNPTEFSGKDSPFSYIDGKLIPSGMGIQATATVNPYKNFYSIADRHAFEAGMYQIRHYHMSFPPGGMVFGYAVDASWGEPTKNLDSKGNPTQIPGSWAITANCPEPYEIKLNGITGELNCSIGKYAGGTVYLEVKVRDWGNGATQPLETVYVEAPSIFNGISNPSTCAGSGQECTYIVPITNQKAVLPGTYPVLFSVPAPEGDPYFLPGKLLRAYQLFTVDVKEIYPPFCKTKTGIHSVFSGSYLIGNSPGALHMDCSFLPVKVAGSGGLFFDGGISKTQQLYQAALIPPGGGNTDAVTLFKLDPPAAGRAIVAQTNEYTGHLIVVSDANPDDLLIYTSTGVKLRNYDLGSGDNGINEPVCLTANPGNGDIWFIGHKGTQGVHLERWAYVQQGGSFEYMWDPVAKIDLSPWLGAAPKPMGLAVNSDMKRLFILHEQNQGSIEVFDISSMPPVHMDEWSNTGIFGQNIVASSVPGLRKLIGGDLVIDETDGPGSGECRMLAFANTTTGGSKLVKLDGWARVLSSASLGSPFSCMALSNRPDFADRTLVLFPMVPSVNYIAFLAPTSGW